MEKSRELLLVVAAVLTAGELANSELLELVDVGNNVKRAKELIAEVVKQTPESEGWA